MIAPNSDGCFYGIVYHVQGKYIRRAVAAAMLSASGCAAFAAAGDESPCQSCARPGEAHLRWCEREIMAIVHWGLNTFTGREWGFGNTPPSVLNPARLDPAQWVQAMKAAEIKSVVLVAKHHDGFCLWPSKDNLDYSVAASPVSGRDVVRETADACRRSGLGFGVYLSPWDRHQASYGTGEYIDYFFSQWRDLMDNYGELCEIWLDGANGGTGWYGGANGGKGERRSIPDGYYRLPDLLKMLGDKHPMAVAFGGGGERSVEWCGNERGSSPETWWCPRSTGDWIPPEADFPLRDGWFWHPGHHPKSLAYLVNAYFETVGRGAVMNIGVAPDRDGRVCDDDAKRLAEFGSWVRAFNKSDCARGASIETKRDGNRFAIELSLAAPAAFECVDVREDISKGQRVESFTAKAFVDGIWKTLGSATTIGNRRIVRFPRIESTRVLVEFEGVAPPEILSVSLREIPALAADSGEAMARAGARERK